MDEINFIVFLSFKFLFHTHKSQINICNILQIVILPLDLVVKIYYHMTTVSCKMILTHKDVIMWTPKRNF